MLTLDVERSVADLARNETEITRDTIQPYLVTHECGVDALTAASEPDDWRALQSDHISAIAQALSQTHEWVMLDTPGTMSEVVAASLNEAAIVLLVSSLDVSSIKDTRTALRILESWAVGPDRIRLVVNDNTRAGRGDARGRRAGDRDGDLAPDRARRVGRPLSADRDPDRDVESAQPVRTRSGRARREYRGGAPRSGPHGTRSRGFRCWVGGFDD